jgi:hypothetical protein
MYGKFLYKNRHITNFQLHIDQSRTSRELTSNSSGQFEMNWSYKYDRDALVGLITSSGMQLVAEYDSTDKRFLSLLTKK